jgi:cysteinyl-tRNA synthetase
VYGPAHIGNLRAFLFYDVLKRVLLRMYKRNVTHVCNLTDVDDKIINKCREEKLDDIGAVTRKFEKLFLDNLASLNVIPATHYPRATEHIPDIVDLVRDLSKQGLAYKNDDGWWFDVSKRNDYGMSFANLKTIDANADFALWKFHKPGVDIESATWDTVLGRGRPGWHIECSAMIKSLLGDIVDIHAGGVDLKFPHHENEIAQGTQCNCWLHNGFVTANNEDTKMSKSLGNTLLLDSSFPTVLQRRAYRYLIVSSHYRTDIAYSQRTIDASVGVIKRLDKLLAMLDENTGPSEDVAPGAPTSLANTCTTHLDLFHLAMSNDLSTPVASSHMFSIVKAAERELAKDATKRDKAGLRRAKQALLIMDEIFGIFYDRSPSSSAGAQQPRAIPANIVELAEERMSAKKSKDYARADAIRKEIADSGFAVADDKGGYRIEFIS